MTKLKPKKSAVSHLLLVLIFAGMTSFSQPLSAADNDSWRIVNYWSEWCAPCRVEIPMFNRLRLRLAKSNVIIVGVNFDEDPRDLTLEIANHMGIEFQTLSQQDLDLLGLKPPNVLPTTYVLSPANEVMAKLIGMQTEQDIIDALTHQGLTLLNQ
jgi:thiol-disulfide isomerase/thioredoxin